MKTKYDIGDHVLIEAVVEGIRIKRNTKYTIKADKVVLEAKEEELLPKPDEFNGCDNCKYDHVLMTAYPCLDCEHNHISHYEPKEAEDLSEE